MGLSDLGQSLSGLRLAAFLAWRSTKKRYTRTYLGLWWLSLERLIYSACLVFLATALFGGEMVSRSQHVLLGIATYSLFTGSIDRGMRGVVWDANLRFSQIPFGVRIARQQLEVAIQFLHDLGIVCLLSVIFGKFAWAGFSAAVGGALLVQFSAFTIGTTLCPIFTRYRDLGPIVQSIIQISFFLSPVFWRIEDLKTQSATARTILVNWNPFAIAVSVVRVPIETGTIPSHDVAKLAALSLILVGSSVVSLGMLRRKAGYWT